MTPPDGFGPSWPTFGASVHRALLMAAMRFSGTGLNIVDTDELVRCQLTPRTWETRRLLAAAPGLGHPVSYSFQPRVAGDGAHPPSPPVAHVGEVEATLREITWRRMRMARRPERSRPVWTNGVRVTLHEALVEAAAHGAVRAGAAHLVVAALADPANRAARRYPESHPRIAVQIGESSLLSQDGPPYPELELPAGPQPGHTRRQRLARATAWRLARLARHDPLLAAVESEQRRQAVRLGHTAVTACHALLAVLDVGYRLVALGLPVPAEIAARNTAARRLYESGVAYDRVHDFAVRAGDDAELACPELTISRLGTHRYGDPLWSQSATAAALLASESALTRRHAAAGTTHLLAGLLTAADSELTSMFDSIGADLSRLVRTIEDDLSAIEPAWTA